MIEFPLDSVAIICGWFKHGKYVVHSMKKHVVWLVFFWGITISHEL